MVNEQAADLGSQLCDPEQVNPGPHSSSPYSGDNDAFLIELTSWKN